MVGPSSFLSGPPKLNLPNLGKKNTRENNVRCFGQNNPQNKVHYSSTASFLFCHFVQLFLTFFFYVVPCRFFPPWCSSVSLLVSFVLFWFFFFFRIKFWVLELKKKKKKVSIHTQIFNKNIMYYFLFYLIGISW